jgi:peroxiredoxin
MSSLAIALWICVGGAVECSPRNDFEVVGRHDQRARLSDYADQDIVVLVFFGTECPLARLYGPRVDALADQYSAAGVAFLGINANEGDSIDDLARFAEHHGIRFPLFKDPDGAVAGQFGATRQLEVFVLDRFRNVKYHGRVDDQYAPGFRRTEPSRDDLQEALEELLAGNPQIAVPETEVAGCLIGRSAPATASSSVTYCKDIAPILNARCVECHRAGQIGPFRLTNYAEVAAWSATIRERVSDGSMPPWHADPHFGTFANERRLSEREKELLLAWIDAGTPEGDPAELPRQRQYTDEWNIGQPDAIVTMPEPFEVPAQGVIDNIAVELDPGFSEDTWIRGTEVRPGNRAVVHHCTVFIGPPGCNHLVDTGKPGLRYFSDFVPGLMPSLLPEGMARRIPAGWHIYFSLHYVPNGAPANDQTSMGLVLARHVEREVFTNNLLNDEFTIAPHDANCEVRQTWTVPRDVLLLSMFPHMHLRG